MPGILVYRPERGHPVRQRAQHAPSHANSEPALLALRAQADKDVPLRCRICAARSCKATTKTLNGCMS